MTKNIESLLEENLQTERLYLRFDVVIIGAIRRETNVINILSTTTNYYFLLGRLHDAVSAIKLYSLVNPDCKFNSVNADPQNKVEYVRVSTIFMYSMFCKT